MSEEKEQERGFQVKDKRFSSKSEAEKEKIIQQREARTGADAISEIDQPSPAQPAADSLPEVNFSALVFSLSTQAVIQLGEMEDPATREKAPNLPQAKQTIGILEILQEKTKGNLTPEEKSMLDSLLYDLRMRYVNICK